MRSVVIKTHTHKHTRFTTRHTCVNRFGNGEPAVCLLGDDTHAHTRRRSGGIIGTHLRGLEVWLHPPRLGSGEGRANKSSASRQGG